MSEKIRKIYRSRKDRIIAGVCSGFAKYLGIDVPIVRLVWILSIFFMGFGIIAYILAWILIPEEP
ncbi:MAG: PspC domain-containing protein [Nanoarchaeota archaeon]|nr:PspC domain-containing protein [Nanoarchaeota archaeon]